MSTLKWFHAPAARGTSHGILLHGFGASGMDLFGMAPELDPDHRISWHFPQAPISLGGNSWAWFPREQRRIELLFVGNAFHDPDMLDDPGIDAAAETLLADIHELGIDPADTVLGGFSQGSMLALWTAGVEPVFPSLLLFSSSLFAPQRLAQRIAALGAAHTPVFQSHGRQDPVLPFHNALRLKDVLVDKGLSHQWHEFDGGHTIPDSAIEAARERI